MWSSSGRDNLSLLDKIIVQEVSKNNDNNYFVWMVKSLLTDRPAPIMLEILPIILLEFPKIFTYYSFVLILLFQNYSQKIHLYRNTSLKILESNPLCWLQSVNNVRYDCSIRVSECSIYLFIYN